MVNNAEFTRFGRLLRSGYYDKLPKESYEYQAIWEEQIQRCMYGYSIGGKFMSGSLYGYVNFGTIQKINDSGRGKSAGLPDLRDIEWELDLHINKAIEQKKNLMVVAGRRLGKSYYASWRCAENAAFHNDKSMVAAGEGVKLTLASQMVYNHLAGLADTELFMPILKGTPPKDMILGYSKKNRSTKKWEDFETGGIIYCRNFSDNKTAANGLSTRFVFIEEIGMFPGLIESYEAMKYCWKEGNTNFGFALLMGTGGDMDSGSVDAAKMFQDPEAYDLLTFEDEQSPERLISLFVPGYMSFNEYRDSEGNINKELAIISEQEEREKLKRSNQPDALYNRLQYSPLNWKEAFLKTSSNIFPVALIQQQIENIETNSALKNLGVKGKLELNLNGSVSFTPDDTLHEVEWPVKPAANNKGCITIYEHPILVADRVPYNLYVAGIDPYAEDTALTSPSLGSTFIYKRLYDPMNGSSDLIVAEYTGRPATTKEYYENVRLLLLYYNAKGLYESNIRGLKEYLESKHCLHLLAYQPPELKDIVKDSVAERTYGIHMSKPVKVYTLNLIRDWLLTEYAEGKFNIEKIHQVNLLKELMNYDDDLNFDRVIAFGLTLLKNTSDHQKIVKEMSGIQGNGGIFASFFKRHGWEEQAKIKNNRLTIK